MTCRGAQIYCTSTIQTSRLFYKALGPYSVSKTALLGLTRALAPELAHSNIRVNCVAPGIIKTSFSSAVRIPIMFTRLPPSHTVVTYLVERTMIIFSILTHLN